MNVRALLLVAAGALSACTVGPDYERPALPAPAAWQSDTTVFPTTAASPAAWWQQLGSSQLDALIDTCLADNLDLRSAAARIRQARAAAGVADATSWPQLDGFGSYSRVRTTEATPSPVRGLEYDTWTLGFDASWELDLFGRLAREQEARGAEVSLSEADAVALRVSLAAEVVTAYAGLVGATARRDVATASVTAAEQLVQLTAARTTGGVGNDLDTARAERLLAAARSRIPAQDRDWQTARNRLAVLLGRTPDLLAATLVQSAQLGPVPDVVALGLPADLIERRPDVRAAEHRLHATTARLGAALAERFPRLSITGFFGLQSDRSNDLLRTSSRALTAGPSLRLPLFTGGGVGAQIAGRQAAIDEALADLEQTVLRAFEEVENATSALQQERRRVTELVTAVAAAERARTFAQQRFDAGIDDFLAVLDAEQSRLDLADQLAVATTEVVRQFAALQKALGG
jgi:NodT family efflux transporter outer membrane factor (OMF) lipoprotein